MRAMETRAVWTRAMHRARSPMRSSARATGRPAAVRVTFINDWTGDVHESNASCGETALAVAAARGAIELTDEFCLEGRCGSCSMRRGDEDDVVLGCRTLVGEGVEEDGASVVFRVGCATGPRFDDTTTWSM